MHNLHKAGGKSASWNIDIDRYLNRVIPAPRLHLLPRPIAWLLGHHAHPPSSIGNVLVWFWAFLGAFAGLLVVGAVFRTHDLQAQGAPIIIASFGATAILEYHTIDSPFAQPRNAFFGSIISAAVGVGITKLFHLSANFESLRWVAGALSVGVASALMGLTKTVHPPAGATALLCATEPAITAIGWFFLPLVILGVALLLAVACLLNNIQRVFPSYWWTGASLNREDGSDGATKPDAGRTGDSEKAAEHPGATGKQQIVIDYESLHIPHWITLEYEEKAMLEALQTRLRDGSKNGADTAS